MAGRKTETRPDQPGDKLRLRDGRMLGYLRRGPTEGRRVVYLHGVPQCRLDVMLYDAEMLERAGVQVAAPDRPGVGLSDARKKPSLLDHAQDIAQLADALEWDRFAVVGYSGGGPYALAAASALGDRVRAVGVASTIGPPEVPEFRISLGKTDQAMINASRFPWVARFGLRAAVYTASFKREQFLEEMRDEFGPAEQPFLVPDALGDQFRLSFIEAMRGQGHGIVADYRNYRRKWGFAVDKITTPVDIWHGTDDGSVPFRHAEFLANRMPQAHFHRLQGIGHIHTQEQWEEILGRAVRRPA